ncbi:hypothetical protein D1007_30796 [Hordeum vulgare]|nr:hypothetical protein D1007_30796 [Hordeum vulgare]
MEQQRCALEEISVHHYGREEVGVVILDESDEEAPSPVRLGYPGHGSNKDGTPVDSNGHDDYTAFYKLLGM